MEAIARHGATFDTLPPDCISCIADFIELNDLVRLLFTGSTALKRAIMAFPTIKSVHYVPDCLGAAKWPLLVSSLTGLRTLYIAFEDGFTHISIVLPHILLLPPSLTDVHFEFGNANSFAAAIGRDLPLLQHVYLNGDYAPRVEINLGPECKSFTLVGFDVPSKHLPSTLTLLSMECRIFISDLGLLPPTLTHLSHLELREDPALVDSETDYAINWPTDLIFVSFQASLMENQLINALPPRVTKLSAWVDPVTDIIPCFPPALTALEMRSRRNGVANLFSILPKGLKKLFIYQGGATQLTSGADLPPELTWLDLSNNLEITEQFLLELPRTLTMFSGQLQGQLETLPLNFAHLSSLYLPRILLPSFPASLTKLECELNSTDLTALPQTLTFLNADLITDISQGTLDPQFPSWLPPSLTKLILTPTNRIAFDPATNAASWPSGLISLRLIRFLISSFHVLPTCPSLRKLCLISSNSQWDPDTSNLSMVAPSLTTLHVQGLPLDDQDVPHLPKRLSTLHMSLRLSESGCRALPRSLGTLGLFQTKPKFDAASALPDACRGPYGSAHW